MVSNPNSSRTYATPAFNILNCDYFDRKFSINSRTPEFYSLSVIVYFRRQVIKADKQKYSSL